MDDLTTVVVHVNFTNSSEVKVMVKHMQKKTVLLWWCIFCYLYQHIEEGFCSYINLLRLKKHKVDFLVYVYVKLFDYEL